MRRTGQKPTALIIFTPRGVTCRWADFRELWLPEAQVACSIHARHAGPERARFKSMAFNLSGYLD